jgi:hypothetical protein
MPAIEKIQIRNGIAVLYGESLFSQRYSKNSARVRNMTEQQKKQYSGKMTVGARKRMTTVIDMMAQCLRPGWVTNIKGQLQYHTLSFLTLTIHEAEKLTHRQVYDAALKPFLQWLRDQGVMMYIWKAEAQLRGQLHYHVTFPDYIHYMKIRNEWNSLLRKAGYLDSYAKVHLHFDANSTDIHAVKKVKNNAAYLIKEFSKAVVESEKGTDGKVWGCSANLLGIKYYSCQMTNQEIRKLDELERQGIAIFDRQDYFAIVKFVNYAPRDLLDSGHARQYREYIDAITDRLNRPGEKITVDMQAA